MKDNTNIDNSSTKNNEIEEGRIAALFSYIPFLCFIPLLSNRKNKFAYEHGKQGFLLLCIEVIALIFLIDFISHIFWILILLGCFILALAGVFRVLLGKYWKIPYIGNIFEKYEI